MHHTDDAKSLELASIF